MPRSPPTHSSAPHSAQGYTLDSAGEIAQLAGYVGAFSTRTAQIGRNLDRYEPEWAAANSGQRPGPALRRSWDARAWPDGRPDKVTPVIAVAERLGHDDPSLMLSTYGHLMPDSEDRTHGGRSMPRGAQWVPNVPRGVRSVR